MIKRRSDGTFALDLDPGDAELLAHLAGQLHALLEDPSADPGLRRLFPPAHTEDVLAEAAWQIEQGEDLRGSRRTALETLGRDPDEPLTEEELVTWMQGVNSLRLVLGERLEMTGDDDTDVAALEEAAAAAEADDADIAEAGRRTLQMWSAYERLTALVGDAIRALGDPT